MNAPVAGWMVYGLVVGTLVAAAAAVAEQLLGGAGRPRRGASAVALGLTVVLVALAPGRVGRAVALPAATVVAVADEAGAPAGSGGWRAQSLAAVASVAHWVGAPVRAIVGAAAQAVPVRAGRWLLAGWGALSAAMVALFAIVYVRFDRARARWPVGELLGTRVRVSPDAGPAVVGLSRPEIVIPGWLLDRSADEQRLVLVHEREHVAARDPLLLAAGCAAAVLIPWHPAGWWMLSRLRLAVELDCDERVLRRGVAAESYGSLLIDLAGRCSGLRIGVTALAGESTHLHQRLIAMTSRHARPSITRTTIAAAFAGVALVAACEAKLPTATEVDGMTASGAATLARKATLLSKDSLDAQYTVDGVAVSAAEANAIAPERIASIEVQKGPAAPNGRGMVSITTRKPGEAGGTLVRKQLRVTGAPGGTDTTIEENALPRRSLDNFSGVILIDGVRSTEAAMQALKPADIVSVEIIKGASAADQYAAPEAKNGVIRVTTRKTRTR